MIKKIAAVLTLFTLLSFTFVTNFRDLVLEKLEGYANDYPEKIYVQTDKPYYTTGDDIWFTAYLVNGITHVKSDISRVVYVELINQQDSIVSKKQLYTKDISVAGDFKIKKHWKPGNYLLRAYTNYMKNSDSDYFFQAQIPVWNISKNDSLNTHSDIKFNTIETTKALSVSPPEISFYPESGYLVNGLATKVGIKVKGQSYKNIELKGTIKDSNGETISAFSTYKFGLSVITLLPEADKTYYASVIFNGEEIKYPFPKALENGYNLNVVNSGNQIYLQVSSNTPVGLKNTFLVAHQRGQLIFEKLETEDTNLSKVKINTNVLADGVASFTLFNSRGKPVCERLVYIDNPNNDVKVNLSVDNKTPKTRDKVSIEIDLNDALGNALSGNLSMAITDIDAVGQSSKSENIKTYLLLNSDLRGHVDDPGYFFEKENDSRRRYLLDLLMLTHGWRRFTWDNLLYENNALSFEAEKGIFISGFTTALNGKKQQISVLTRLTIMGKSPYQEKKKSDINGKFKFGPYILKDTISALIESRVKDFKSDDDKKNRDVSIYLDDEVNNSPKINRNTFLKAKTEDSTKIIGFLNQANRISQLDSEFLKSARLLDEIVITAKKKSGDEKREGELNDRTNYGFPSNRLDMRDYEDMGSFTVLDLLNLLPGVSAFNDSISIRGQGQPGVYLDNIPVQLGDISFMQANEIEFIDVLKGADAAFFANSGNGIITIYSKTGNGPIRSNVKRKPGIIDFTATGFYTAREFYAPDHINGLDEAMKADIRTTLHWEPKIVLDENTNKTQVSFFTSDVKSKYAIKIEGITDTGIPVYHLSTIEVN